VFSLNTVLVVTGVSYVSSINQSSKTLPSFSGVGREVSLPSMPVVPVAGDTVPPLALKVMV